MIDAPAGPVAVTFSGSGRIVAGERAEHGAVRVGDFTTAVTTTPVGIGLGIGTTGVAVTIRPVESTATVTPGSELVTVVATVAPVAGATATPTESVKVMVPVAVPLSLRTNFISPGIVMQRFRHVVLKVEFRSRDGGRLVQNIQNLIQLSANRLDLRRQCAIGGLLLRET